MDVEHRPRQTSLALLSLLSTSCTHRQPNLLSWVRNIMAHTRLRRVAGVYRFTTKMTSDIFTSFRRFIHPLLCLLRMSQPLPYNDEFPEKRIVQDWERSLLERYYDNAHYRSRLRSCRISRIRRYKKTTGVEHEYLVVEVLDPASHWTRYLQVERTAADPRYQNRPRRPRRCALQCLHTILTGIIEKTSGRWPRHYSPELAQR